MPSSVSPWWQSSLAAVRRLTVQVLTRRGLLIFAGALVCLYAVTVLVYVQSLPDLGLRTAFSTGLKAPPRGYRPADARLLPRAGDRVVRVGAGASKLDINTWPHLLAAPRRLRAELTELPPGELPARGAKVEREGDEDVLYVQVAFERPPTESSPPLTIRGWCRLGRLPLEELVPSVLWFFLKITLFLIGALVLWNRPSDTGAAVFFLLCIVTLGAYMGGYHWPYIATQPALLLVFMVCGVLLPVVSLHFYLTFPRPKVWFQRHPRWTLLAVYGLPLAFLAFLVFLYFRARWSVRHEPPFDVAAALDLLRKAIYVYLGVAAAYFLASVIALLHSHRTVTDPTERNQVKWILYGALLALVPIGYSLYLAIWETDAFGAGAATWPMFAASACLTAAFAVSITRYGLMELDKIITSGAGYFLVSALAGLAYYAIVFLGTLIFNQALVSPPLTQALTVSTTALVLMVVLDLARSRVKKAWGRRFDREKYQLDRTLQRMGQAIQQLVDPPTLANRLLHASAELLGVPRGAVYLLRAEVGVPPLGGGEEAPRLKAGLQPPLYRLAGSLGEAPVPVELPPDAPLVQALQGQGAVTLPARWVGVPLTPAQEQLRALGGEIAHALAHEGRLLALLVLGPKDRSPYSPEDLNLLAAFAQITVLALESAQGHQTIELLNRDLQKKVEKISEQQRRILALQSELRRRKDDKVTRWQGDKVTEVKPAPVTLSPCHPATLSSSGIIGSGPELRQTVYLVQKVAANEKTVVLIRGESGTGKGLLAQAIHDHSPRAGKPFVKVHCAALSQTLLESELFGHVKGAFTGAHRDKVGRFELANGGTLFLDEIGDISLEVQTKLLRVLQEMTFERVGSSEPVKVDVRILAATHQNLEELIRQGRFRLDLFYRLNVFPIVVPPLRQRCDDIPELVQHFLRVAASRCERPAPQIDDDALNILKQYHWPGNIRELENVIERAVVIAEGDMVTMQELPEEVLHAVDGLPGALGWPEEGEGLAEAPRGVRLERTERNRREREQILQALAGAKGNKAEAARALGLARSTLVSRLKKHGLG